MTSNSPTVKKLIQVSEQVFDPIQVPVQVGGDVYIIVQQDVRKIEDTRYLSYYKYEQNSLNSNNPEIQNQSFTDENRLWDNLITALLAVQSSEVNQHKINFVNNLLENLRYNYNSKANYVASEIEKQMEWENSNQEIRNHVCPSSSNLNNSSNIKKYVRFFLNECDCSESPVIMKNRGIGTTYLNNDLVEEQNVREQLLEKKKATDIF